MAWAKRPRKFQRGERIVHVMQVAKAADEGLWLYTGTRLIHAKAVACFQFHTVCRMVMNGSIYYAETTKEWRERNDLPIPF